VQPATQRALAHTSPAGQSPSARQATHAPASTWQRVPFAQSRSLAQPPLQAAPLHRSTITTAASRGASGRAASNGAPVCGEGPAHEAQDSTAASARRDEDGERFDVDDRAQVVRTECSVSRRCIGVALMIGR
jgi:hypothetical protein